MHHFRYHFLREAFPNGGVNIPFSANRTAYGFFTAELCRDVLNLCCHLVVYISAKCRTVAVKPLDRDPHIASCVLPRGTRCLALEYSVDRCLGALFALSAGNTH